MSDEKHRKLSPKQYKFVEAYCGDAQGNATEAASLAGYKGNRVTLRSIGTENLSKPLIRRAIENRQAKDELVMSGAELRQLWTRMAIDPKVKDRDRLRASELLAKAGGMFIERQIVDHRGKVQAELVESERTAFQKLLEDSTITEAIRTSLSLQDVPS